MTASLAEAPERHFDQALLVEGIPFPNESAIGTTEEIPATECFCVPYIRETFGVPIRGDADTFKSNITLSSARKGDVVLLKYGTVSLVVYLLQIFPGGMWVAERILLQGKCVTRERMIEWKDNKAIYGFYREIKTL